MCLQVGLLFAGLNQVMVWSQWRCGTHAYADLLLVNLVVMRHLEGQGQPDGPTQAAPRHHRTLLPRQPVPRVSQNGAEHPDNYASTQQT